MRDDDIYIRQLDAMITRANHIAGQMKDLLIQMHAMLVAVRDSSQMQLPLGENVQSLDDHRK